MELNYKVFGQGEPIIILHGLFGTLDNWQTIAKRLAENYMVFIIDQRNHGRSPHVDGLDYPSMAEDLYDFMNENWIHQARIIGHSMGGKVAMQFALENPEMVEQLVVVDIGPQKNKGNHQAIFDALFSLDLKNTTNRKMADAFLLEKMPDYGVRQFLLKNLSRNPSGGYRWKMNLEVIYENYENILAAIESEEQFDAPTLFIKGGKSDYLFEHQLSDIQMLFPSATMSTIAKSGHWVHADAPLEFQELVEAFFQA